MKITRYEDMDDMAKDMMREIGSIGTGNAATALSSLLGTEVKMTVPSGMRRIWYQVSLLKWRGI